MAGVSRTTALALEPSEITPINDMPADTTDGQAASSPVRRKTYNLQDLNIPLPKKKVYSTFFGTVSIWRFVLWTVLTMH